MSKLLRYKGLQLLPAKIKTKPQKIFIQKEKIRTQKTRHNKKNEMENKQNKTKQKIGMKTTIYSGIAYNNNSVYVI